MIEPTDEMIAAFQIAEDAPGITCGDTRAGLAAVLAIVERDYLVARRLSTELTPEEAATLRGPRLRLRTCVERWPGAEIEGDYDPRCCRFPKSCSASVYEGDAVTDDDLEPPW